MTPTERAHNDAEIKCKLANERFGLQQGLRLVLSRFNCNDKAVEHIIKLAQDRKLHDLKSLVDSIGSIENNKPYHARIESPPKAWNPSNDTDNDEHALNRFK